MGSSSKPSAGKHHDSRRSKSKRHDSGSSRSSHKGDHTAKTSPQESIASSKVQESQTIDFGPVWKAIKRSNITNPSSTTVVVVNPEEAKPMTELVEKKKKNRAIKCQVIITEKMSLQKQLDALAKSKSADKMAELHLLVSSAIHSITYHISKALSKVFVGPCFTPGQLNPCHLLIESGSTYRQFPTWAWDSRPQELQDPDRNITHGEGCYFDFGDRLLEAETLFRSRIVSTPELSDGSITETKNHFGDLAKQLLLDQKSTDAATSSSAQSSFSSPVIVQGNGGGQPEISGSSWLGPWGAILYKAFSVLSAEGFAGFHAQFHLSREGIFVKGSAGMSLALRRMVGMGERKEGDTQGSNTIITAGTLLYFVPWESVSSFLERILWKIWDFVRGVVAAVWEKIKSLAAGVVLHFKAEQKVKDTMVV